MLIINEILVRAGFPGNRILSGVLPGLGFPFGEAAVILLQICRGEALLPSFSHSWGSP